MEGNDGFRRSECDLSGGSFPHVQYLLYAGAAVVAHHSFYLVGLPDFGSGWSSCFRLWGSCFRCGYGGFFSGLHFLLYGHCEDYTNFNPLFIEFPFCLTDRTGDSFAICQVFSIVPMLLLLLAGLVVKVGQMLQVKNRFWYFLIGLSWTFTYPWLRMSAVLSQPDWFGLIFAFSILLLTLDFRFERLDLPRFGLLFLATAAIILSRRWYLYFVVGYYFAYAVLVLVSSARIAKVGRRQEALLLLNTAIRMPSPSPIRIGSGLSFCTVSRGAGRGF